MMAMMMMMMVMMMMKMLQLYYSTLRKHASYLLVTALRRWEWSNALTCVWGLQQISSLLGGEGTD